MKPRVFSLLWTRIETGEQTRHWHVEFEDSCGCVEEVDFPNYATALRFARYMADGGDRWTFA